MIKTRKEAVNILQHQEVLVDGKRRYSPKHLIGFMDILSLPKAKAHYRMIVNQKGLKMVTITEAEAKSKLVKVTGKTSVAKDKIQIHTNDGRNITIPKDNYKVGDTLVIGLPKQDVQDHLKLEKGAMVLLTRGSHVGSVGKVESIEGKNITFTSGEKYETKVAFAFVIGKDKPMIKVA